MSRPRVSRTVAEGHRRAKEVLLDYTDGAPLTICLGDVCRPKSARWRKKSVTPYTWGTVGFTVQGCGAIFADATHLHGGETWPGFCDACSNPNRKPHRDQGRAVKRRVEAMAHRKNATVYEVTDRLGGQDQDERPEAI